MDTAALFAQAEARANDFWGSLPDDLTIIEAMTMDDPGERNLALRKALGIKWPGKTVVKVSLHGHIEVVTPNKNRAEWHAHQLREALPRYTVNASKTSGGWFVHGYPSDLTA